MTKGKETPAQLIAQEVNEFFKQYSTHEIVKIQNELVITYMLYVIDSPGIYEANYIKNISHVNQMIIDLLLKLHQLEQPAV